MENTDRPADMRVDRNVAGAGSRPRLRKDGLWCVHLSCGAARNDAGEIIRVRRSIYGHTLEEAERKAAALWAGLAAAEGDRRAVLDRVDLILGLRQGELLGLRWANVDLDGARLTVREQLQRRMPDEGAGARLVLRGLKSDAAYRCRGRKVHLCREADSFADRRSLLRRTVTLA